MTSRCSRSSQPNNAAIIRCSGITHGVYDNAAPTQFLDTTRSTQFSDSTRVSHNW
jgi:hypothetical protein